MNAAETIAAAIEKLEGLNESAQRGRWYAHENILGQVRVRVIDQVIAEVYDDDETANAELIVTLHRTIDAQLGLLRAILDTHLNSIPLLFDEYEVWPIPAYAIDLARAILGGAS